MNQIELKNKIKLFNEETKKKNEAFFKEAISFLFEEHPTLKEFSWVQYTPCYCDGYTCEFSANTSDVNINGEKVYEWSINERIKKASRPGHNEEVKFKIEKLNHAKKQAIEKEDYKLAEQIKGQISIFKSSLIDNDEVEALKKLLPLKKSITEILGCFDDDTLKTLFGDHVTVRIYKDRVETEEYDHG